MKDSFARLWESIDVEHHVIATYYLETPLNLFQAAEAFAAEQSTGTWKRVGKETSDLRERHGAKILSVLTLPYSPENPRLPSATAMQEFSGEGPINAGIIRLAFPWKNFGHNIAMLLSTVAGNLYEMGAFYAVKLLDLDFPASFVKGFQGPKFGITGTRKILNVEGRPLVGAIVKPNVGLSVDELAELAYEGFRGGLDFLKDDELIADAPYSTVEERVKKLVAVMKKAEDETGEKKMYAFNITDKPDRVLKLHDIVVKNGGNCVMLNAATAGIPVLQLLAEHTEVPIHCHRDFAPMWARSPYIGLSFPVITKLFRIAGADQCHVGAIQGKLYESDDEVLANALACTGTFHGLEKTLPVSSGGQWAGKVPVNYRMFGHVDFLHLAGGGVFGHPDGPAIGARSMRIAWQAVLEGVPLHQAAREHPELKKAIECFGEIIE